MRSNIKSSNTVASLFIMITLAGGVQISQAKDKENEPTSVTVNNTVDNPVPVAVQNQVSTKRADNPAFQPYQAEAIGVISPNGNYSTASFDVPAGKRLVIELVTISATVEVGILEDATVSLAPLGGISRISHHLTPSLLGPISAGRYNVFAVTQPLRLYSEAGTGAVQVQAYRDNATGLYSVHFSISGYLVDLP